MITPIVDPLSEEAVATYLHDVARLAEGNYNTDGWAFPTLYHFLLSHGRRFTVSPPPPDLTGMEPRLCYSNAARYARDHRSEGLVYAEGFALPGGVDFPLAHAWCVRADGTVLDPTWADTPGRAYIGVAFRDPQRWPYDGGGILQDPDRSYSLLKDGLPEGSLLPAGRPL
ncbi:hypothetical protein [Streptomyces nitrosporeus]|uniref:hypothetical protein n=1 Tax=Streptomyces nitrosporeus TaxID=28894 RepID=UPI0039A39350